MNGNSAELILRIKGCPVVRFILFPVMRIRVWISKQRYLLEDGKSKVAKYSNIHEGEACFIVGNGPSLSASDLDMISNFKSFGMNRIYNVFGKTKWRPDYYIAIDEEFIMSEWKHIKNVECKKIFVKNLSFVKSNDHVIPIFIKSTTPIRKHKFIKRNISKNISEGFSLNYSVACYALELAIYMGFKRIYLIGIDHKFPKEINSSGKIRVRKNTKEHFDGGSYNVGNVSYYIDSVTSCFLSYKKYADENSILILNASRETALNVFDLAKLEDIIEYESKSKN